MSCRETKGNSAVTSFARYITGAEERTVSREFHAARRDAHKRLGHAGKDAAQVEDVVEHLRALRDEIDETTLISDRNKASLYDRIDYAEMEACKGLVPNRATFIAWTRLRDYIANVQTVTSVVPEQPDAVTAEEVAEARRHLQDAEQALVSAGSGHRRTLLARIRAAKTRYDRLQAAYDVTPHGYADLRHTFRIRGATDPDVATRWRVAQEHFAARNADAGEPSTLSLQDLARQAAATRRKVAQLDAMHKSAPTSRNKDLLKTALVRYRTVREAYLEKIAATLPLPPTSEPGSATSVQAWASTSDDTVSRRDLWAAAEYVLARDDKRNEKVGRADAMAINRRALQRAEARQAVLDAEGRGEIDPINARFAESVRRKRRIA